MSRFFGDRFDARQVGVSVKRCCYFSRGQEVNTLLINRSTVSVNFMVPASTTQSEAASFLPIDRRHSFSQGKHDESAVNTRGVSMFPFKFDPLFIEDPLEERNNVARNCFRVHQVQKCFSDAANAITEKLQALDQRARTGCWEAQNRLFAGLDTTSLLEELVGTEFS